MNEEKEIKNLIYTVIGSSNKPNPFHICFKGSGLKFIANQIENDDIVTYKTWEDVSDEGNSKRYYSKWTIKKSIKS